MPMNNNQVNTIKVQTAAARLAKLPVVLSACTKLSVLYTDAKYSHPNLRSLCEVLESSVAAACDRVSPLIVKLEPQISMANDVACKSLDWLETTFPVLHTPTEKIVATAKNKMHEIQDVVSIAANGTVDCVQHTATWLMGRMQQDDDQAHQSLVERTISMANTGLDSALVMSEALMDLVIPPTEQDKEDAHLLEGFEAATLKSSYSVRLVSLTTKLCRRTYHMVVQMQSVQIMGNLSRSSPLVQELQTSCLTLAWSIQGLPQYVQHQLVCVFFFISQMYNLCCPPAQHQFYQDKSRLNAVEASSPHKDGVQIHPQATPTCRKRKPNKMPVFDHGCNVTRCVR